MQEFPTLLHALASHAKTIPDKVALIEAETDKTCTYAELWAYVKAFSKRLEEAGVKRDFGDGYGTRVVVRCSQTIDYIVTALAIQLSHGVSVPVEKNIADDRIAEIIADVNCGLFIAEKHHPSVACKQIPLASATLESSEDIEADMDMPPLDTLSLILFTTGTTGKSKGVMHTNYSQTAYFMGIHSAYGFDDKQIWLIPLPLTHASGLFRTESALYHKCSVVLMDGYSFAKYYFSAANKYNVTILSFTSAAAEMYLRAYKELLMGVKSRVEYVLLGGSTTSEAQIRSLYEIFRSARIIQTYGATEVHGCYVEHSRGQHSVLCIGQPIQGCSITFYDPSKSTQVEASAQNPGLIAINSASKMLGYWHNDALTESVVRGDYVVLSDLGYRGDDGLLYFVGRADDVIVSGGYKIAPLEIEEAANAFEGVRESVCAARKDTIMGEVPVLYVVMDSGVAFNYLALLKHLRGRLEAYRIPRFIEEIAEIPKINGKIHRKELRNRSDR